MNGNDRLFSLALQSQASGCITALASLASPLLRRVWDHASRGEQDGETQSRLNAAETCWMLFRRQPPSSKKCCIANIIFRAGSTPPIDCIVERGADLGPRTGAAPDDPACDAEPALEREGVADRDDVVADLHLVGIVRAHGREVARVYLEDGDVGARIVAHDTRGRARGRR